MISTSHEYRMALGELRRLEDWLARLLREHPAKGLTKSGIRKMTARLHEELAVYEGSRRVDVEESSSGD